MIRFRKLYQWQIVEGAYIDAIVAYGKIPNAKKKDDTGQTYVAQYRKILYIDCWLFVLRFKWLSREK